MAHGSRSWTACAPVVMRPTVRNGRSAPIRPSSARISTRQELAGLRLSIRSRGARSNDKNREGLGKSRGGWTTKIHLIADRRCRPIARLTSAGQHADCPRFIPLMEQIRIVRRGLGRPRRTPGAALADKAYSSKAQPCLPTPAQHSSGHPGQGGSEGQPAQAWLGRWPTSGVRSRALQGTQHRRTLRQQAQELPSSGYQIRQARTHLPGHHRRRLDPDLAPRPGEMTTRLIASGGRLSSCHGQVAAVVPWGLGLIEQD
jgi:hypothetical protein